jgi:carbonic anhydrase/acetyltransferase-like protein (isoleucine patch superfamily)
MKLDVHASAFIAPGAVVVGDVTLGARSSVWFGTVLRGDMDAVRVGEESNVQDNSVFHVDLGCPATVGRRVVVGHRAVVHGATVEDGSLIGMGSVLLNRSRIGAGSLVAAGALVGEDKEFEPRSLIVGVPARAVGEVNDELAVSISRGADHYVALGRAYLERGIGSPPPSVAQPAYLGQGFPAIDELEIARLLGVLASSPGQLAAALSGAGEEALDQSGSGGGPSLRWLAREWLGEEDALWGPRLERLLTEEMPELEPVGGGEAPALSDAASAVEQLARTRNRHLAVLRELPLAGWRRAGIIRDEGAVTVMEHVRRWAGRDRAYLRQMTAARRSLGLA